MQVSWSRYLLQRSVWDVTLMSSKRTDWLTVAKIGAGQSWSRSELGQVRVGAGQSWSRYLLQLCDVTLMSSKRTDWLTGILHLRQSAT